MPEAIDPKSLVGELVRVHYNRHRCKPGYDPLPGDGCWVVKTKQGSRWLVAGYVDDILLKNVKLHVAGKKSIDRLRRTKSREVVAWFQGTVVDANNRSMKKAIGGGEWEGVGFNPFNNYSFYVYDTGVDVDYAQLAYVSGRKAIVLFEIPNPGESADDPEEYLEVLVEELGGDVAGDDDYDDEYEDNPAPQELDGEQKMLRRVVADHWVKEGFYRGRTPIYKLFDKGAWTPFYPLGTDDPDYDPWTTSAGEWVDSMDIWKWLARAVIFTEYGTPKPYDPGAYYESLDAVLEPLGYKHSVINAAVVAIMVDPYSDRGEQILTDLGY